MRRLLSLAAPAALLLAVGCKGQISGDSSGGGGGSGSTTGTGSNTGGGSITGTGTGGSGSIAGTGTGSTQGTGSGGAGATGSGGGTALALASSLASPSPCSSSAPGPRKLWRLTASEFANSIRSIFSDTSNQAPLTTVFSDPMVLGFSIDANGLLVQGLNASQLEDNAEGIAAWAASAGKLTSFASCASQTTGAPAQSCATSFIQAFGKVAFRTTLASNDARIAKYTSIFMLGSSNSDGAQAVVSAMLQSPYFLYRSELGTQSGSTYKLTPYEVATELAYTLTGTTPDSQLLTAADSANNGGSISSMVDQQANRLIGSSGSATNSTAVMGFMDGWLGLSRLYTTAHDATVYQLSSALQQDMWNESQGLIMEAFNNNGSFGSVLTSDHSFLNQELATFYGISAGLGSSFTSVKYAGLTSRDPGLLATGTILNGYARPDTDSPTQRGHMIRSRLLCQDIPMPPPGLNTTFMPATTTETTRDHFINEHESNAACYACHKEMDWIGFAFENYDGWGRYRTTDNGLPTVDTAVIYADPEGNDDNVTGLSGSGSLPAFLAQSDDVTRCMQRYWTYYTYGSSSWTQDACTYDAVYNEAKTNGSSLKSTLMAILHAPNFTTRVKDQ